MKRPLAANGPALLLILAVCAGCIEEPRPRNLVLVTVDTLRADRLGAWGYEAADTPVLDALAARGLRFERAYAHSSMTLPSTASLLTGRHPAALEIYDNLGALSAELPTLATRLEGAGFDSAAFVGNYALRPSRGLDRGFQSYTRDYTALEAIRPHPENPGDALNEQALAWFDGRADDRPFFLWVHYQEPHGPYTPSHWDEAAAARPGRELPMKLGTGRGGIPAYQWLGHGRLPEYRARYDGEIADVDRHLGELLDGLDERGLLRSTALVFTADHGEAFGEDGLFCAHGEGLGEALLHVPLLLVAPGLEPGVRREPVRLIDVAPTALGLLGLPADDLPGTTLLDASVERPLVAQVRERLGWRTARLGAFELLENRPGAPQLRLRGSEEETVDPRRIQAQLTRLLERQAPWPPPGSRPELSAEEREALRAMGYAIDADE